jgi:hypothetical protein
MAYIQPVLGAQLVIQVGNGATPEVFAAPSLINTSRGISFSTATESDELIDLADQLAPAQMIRRVKSVDTKIDGAGMVHKADVLGYLQWASKGTVKNIKITDGNWVVTGPYVLTSFNITGERLKSSECSMTFEQAGAVTITPTV